MTTEPAHAERERPTLRPMTTAEHDLLETAKRREWYHTLELQPGVWTEGWFDLRESIEHYGLPQDMTGMRALEVGTWDGFWAFEMERRGADVVAIDLDDEADLDWPPRLRPPSYPEQPRGAGFRLAKEIRGSEVERVNCSIYNALPEDLGTFDLVFCGSVLIHLRDQMLALERIANLCHGTFISAEPYDRLAGLIPMSVSRFSGHHNKMVFWTPSIRTWKRLLWAAGFNRVEQRGKFTMHATDLTVRHVVFHAHKSP
jgi:tRNA (mo5U34)-methyltransferase